MSVVGGGYRFFRSFDISGVDSGWRGRYNPAAFLNRWVKRVMDVGRIFQCPFVRWRVCENVEGGGMRRADVWQWGLTVVLVVGLSGCAGRGFPGWSVFPRRATSEMESRTVPGELRPDGKAGKDGPSGTAQAGGASDSAAAPKTPTKAGTAKDGEPPLPSSLVSPMDADAERQSLVSARQIRPLTMSDDPARFVPQTGKYAIPDGLSSQEYAALSRGVSAGTAGDTISDVAAAGPTTSTVTAMAASTNVATGGMTGDPEVAPAHHFGDMLAASAASTEGTAVTPVAVAPANAGGTFVATNTLATGSSAATGTTGIGMVNGGMVNPMTTLGAMPPVEGNMGTEHAMAAVTQDRSVLDLPSDAGSPGWMTTAPATSLAAISASSAVAAVPAFPGAAAPSAVVTPVSANLSPAVPSAVVPASATAFESVHGTATAIGGSLSTADTTLVPAAPAPHDAVSLTSPDTPMPEWAAFPATVGSVTVDATTTPPPVAAASGTIRRGSGFRPGSTRGVTPVATSKTIPVTTPTDMESSFPLSSLLNVPTAADAAAVTPPATSSASTTRTSISLNSESDTWRR